MTENNDKYKAQKKYLKKKKQLRVWVDEEKYNTFKSAVEKKHTSIYALINNYINDYIEQNKAED